MRRHLLPGSRIGAVLVLLTGEIFSAKLFSRESIKEAVKIMNGRPLMLHFDKQSYKNSGELNNKTMKN